MADTAVSQQTACKVPHPRLIRAVNALVGLGLQGIVFLAWAHRAYEKIWSTHSASFGIAE